MALRRFVLGCVGWAVLGGAGLARAQQDVVEQLLSLKPTMPGVEYDQPADKAAIAACKVESQKSPDGSIVIAYTVRDGQGKILRKFVDLDGKLDDRKKPTLDQFSYYQDGFEVYRESDLDGDRNLDECRWMNSGGTRVLKVRREKDRYVYRWERLSAEEASKVMVQALVLGDLSLLESVMATPDELAALKLPQGLIDQTADAAAKRVEQVKALRSLLKGWEPKTVWSRFDGLMPRAIPADEPTGLHDDLLLYENAVIFAAPAGGQGDPTKLAYLQVPELIRLGEVWKFLSLPQAVDPAKPVVTVAADGLRGWLYRGSASPIHDRDPALAEAEKRLADYDAKNLASVDPADPKTVLKFHYGRLAPLREILKVATRPEDVVLYNKQVVDDLASCYQTGLYPDGGKMLDEMVKLGGKVASYAAFRKILAEYAMDDNPANPLAHQKAYLSQLEQFVKAYPHSDEAPDALLQLASNLEFSAEEDEARSAYQRLVRDFPDTEPGRKAAGALRRLDLLGKTPTIRGTGLRGETIDLANYRGKTVAILFWHSGYEPVRRELPELVKVGQKHKDKGLVLLGVNLDGGDPAAVESFLKSNPLPWPQIIEPRGMDGTLANEFGILSLPTLFVVDPQGKVTHRTLRTAAELDRLMERSVASKPEESLGIK